MRIISGKYKGRKLMFTTNKQLRPTQDRVKESVFNILNSHCHKAIVLDAFSGSGSLGLEALSRGAKHVVFIDKEVSYIKENVSWVDEKEAITIIQADAITYCKKTDVNFDLIFLDPPWEMPHLFDRALKAIFDFDILNPNGIIVCEHKKKMINFDNYNCFKQVNYGQKRISLIRGHQ
ncbi:16S rRNA (guanine(966)-N(2))-methyltransferase RsmD [Candidatus Marinamargulisbacteria bacterium SCGC AG-333-B06]|nr:16S rRNA (guanine(966)-N(2))-methyltransferase RsmD [Candidatus Marinamargulisbacteria bacterium SCGC AG-333-B06]